MGSSNCYVLGQCQGHATGGTVDKLKPVSQTCTLKLEPEKIAVSPVCVWVRVWVHVCVCTVKDILILFSLAPKS